MGRARASEPRETQAVLSAGADGAAAATAAAASASDAREAEEFTEEQLRKIARAEEIVGYEFKTKRYLLSAITHPSATEGLPANCSYERLEFLGDSLLGALVAFAAFEEYHDLDEGGLTRIKVSLVSGASLSIVAEELGFVDVIVFGSSEAGTGRRGLHSALENVYEATVAALYLDGGVEAARAFVSRTLIPRMSREMACVPDNPKSALQEKLQEDGITPTYKLVDTQGPPHDRTFIAQVFAGTQGLALGRGRTKKEAESQAAKSTLARLGEFFGSIGKKSPEEEAARAARKAEEEAVRAARKAQKEAERAARKAGVAGMLPETAPDAAPEATPEAVPETAREAEPEAAPEGEPEHAS